MSAVINFEVECICYVHPGKFFGTGIFDVDTVYPATLSGMDTIKINGYFASEINGEYTVNLDHGGSAKFRRV